MKPKLFCFDLEGVFFPEIWISVAKRFGVKKLALTTRDIPDYDKLMRYRIGVLREESILLADIQSVIRAMNPLPGAAGFLKRIRAAFPVIILSDTFYQFAGPVMKKLGHPVLFANTLQADKKGFVSGYEIRLRDGKKKAVQSLKALNFCVTAVGDSYNDLGMLKAADRGIFFNPPAKIAKAHPRLPVARDYEGLMRRLLG